MSPDVVPTVANVGRQRTRNYLRQVSGSAVYKAGAVAATFVAIPITLRYLGPAQFGVWSTLLSVLSWAVFLDFGIANGLRNKVAEALARQSNDEAASYVASGYTLLAALTGTVWLGMMASSWAIPWSRVFNAAYPQEETLRLTVQIVGSSLLLNFWVGLIGAVAAAVQRSALIAGGQFLSNALSVALVFGLSRWTTGSMPLLATVYGFSLVIANLLISARFYRHHRFLRPVVALRREHARPLLSTGLQFFIIQLSVLVIFTTDKLLITQFFGPVQVASYEVVFRLFSMVTVAHTLLTAPLLPAYTDAYHRSDMAWLRAMLRRQQRIFMLFVAATAILAGVARPLIGLWVGPELTIDPVVVTAIAVCTVFATWNNVHGTLLGGVGWIRLGSIYTPLAALANIPLAYAFAVLLGGGVAGIVSATAVSISISSFVSPLQVAYLVSTRRTPRLDRLLQ